MKGYQLTFRLKRLINWSRSCFSAVFMCVLVPFIMLRGDEICELKFTGCPDMFNGDTIYVSPDIVAVSAQIAACEPQEISEGMDTTVVDSSCVPSIMFLIDNSGSMTGAVTGNEGADRFGSRYTVIADMLDSIYKVHPNAEVGVVVFREFLYFDPRSEQYYSQYFRTMPTVYDTCQYQAYLPLMQLNREYEDGKTGLEIIKDVMEADTMAGEDQDYVDILYKPEFETYGWTNINIGFLAVEEAMKQASAPKSCQFVVFFSDGVANSGNGGWDADRDRDWYMDGINAPTTFTIFFTSNAVAPASLVTMTSNIQNNGYSISNPESNLWTIETSHEALLSLLSEKILGYLLNVKEIFSTGIHTELKVNGEEPKFSSDTSFVFNGRFPLNADVTPFSMEIAYEYTNQSNGKKRDSVLDVEFTVIRQPGVSLPNGLGKDCWERPALDLLYNGVSLLGGAIDETMDTLVVRLTPNDQEISAATVEILSSMDELELKLSEGSTFWFNEFGREVAEDGVSGDKILQHEIEGDSIIVVWRNPDIPLDTVRIAVPFRVSRTLKIEGAAYFDNDADGFVDSIFVDMNVDSMMEGDLEEIAEWITLPASRKFDSVSYVRSYGGFAILVRQKGAPVKTYTDENDILVIDNGIISHGGMLDGGEIMIADSIAPVILKAVFDRTDSLADKLDITFSEPVGDISSAQPFLFCTGEGTVYSVFLEEGIHDSSRYIFNVDTIISASPPRRNDSVWINTEGGITDVNSGTGNEQKNPENRRVLLEVKTASFNVQPLTVNNPYRTDPGMPDQQGGRIEQTIRAVLEIYNKAGTQLPSEDEVGPIVVIKPEGASFRQIDTLMGVISIFDVVKNVIIERDTMVFDPDTKQLFYIWNGRNRNNKKVATGTYNAVIEIRDNADFKERKMTRLGVKR